MPPADRDEKMPDLRLKLVKFVFGPRQFAAENLARIELVSALQPEFLPATYQGSVAAVVQHQISNLNSGKTKRAHELALMAAYSFMRSAGLQAMQSLLDLSRLAPVSQIVGQAPKQELVYVDPGAPIPFNPILP
jgi:hypothetical protein